MNRLQSYLTPVALVLSFSVSAIAAETIALSADNMEITKDAVVKPGRYRLPDPGDDGAVRIIGNDITVDFQGAEIDGSTEGRLPDAFTGRGIIIRGRNITLRNAKVRGYKVGIYANECPGLLIEDVDVSGNYQKRLLSTPEAEDGSDWIFGHENDKKEWIANYGAALYVELSDKITLRRVKARHGQNGICIDRVNDSKIYDNDCSFLSGWGLAMWRSNRNVITRNAFDFCVRGYSHGVYNRGQDSAGIFMFEQNCENVLAENSATHGGDCFFGFAGLEALGDKPAPSPDFDYRRRGNNDNLLINNDFSYAPAHGIEMTFSFGNKFIGNRLVGNAICGVWGGYSQDTLIAGNIIEDNGGMGYGLERGGVNIEHGSANVIKHNTFKNNRCGVHLWCAPNPDFMQKPWGKANHQNLKPTTIAWNTFEGDEVGFHLRHAIETILIDNRMTGVKREMVADENAKTTRLDQPAEKWDPPQYPVFGDTRPVGARKQLAGRQSIIMTEWGPYDFTDFIVHPHKVLAGEKATVQILGPSGGFKVAKVAGSVHVTPMEGRLPGTVTVSAVKKGVLPFSIELDAGGKKLSVVGTLVSADWDVKFYKWDPADDPREHQDRWEAMIAKPPVETRKLSAVDFKWGGGQAGDKVGADHFGTVATTTIELPAGKYKIWTISDDGIRVWIDDQRIIDDWTWHPPKENGTTVELEAGAHTIRVEHFEIDGVAQLQFRMEPAEQDNR